MLMFITVVGIAILLPIIGVFGDVFFSFETGSRLSGLRAFVKYLTGI